MSQPTLPTPVVDDDESKKEKKHKDKKKHPTDEKGEKSKKGFMTSITRTLHLPTSSDKKPLRSEESAPAVLTTPGSPASSNSGSQNPLTSSEPVSPTSPGVDGASSTDLSPSSTAQTSPRATPSKHGIPGAHLVHSVTQATVNLASHATSIGGRARAPSDSAALPTHPHPPGLPHAASAENNLFQFPPLVFRTEFDKEWLSEYPKMPELDPNVVKPVSPEEPLMKLYLHKISSIGPILVCIFVAWIFGWLGWSVVWLVLLGITIWYVQQHELERGWRVFYRNAERRRKHMIAKFTDERTEWINAMLRKIWPTISDSASALAKQIAAAEIKNQLHRMKPPQVDDVTVESIRMGTIPPELLAIRGYNEVTMLPPEEVGFVEAGRHEKDKQASIDPGSTYQMDVTVNYDGDLEIHAGLKLSVLKLMGGLASVPIVVKDITFSGKMRIQIYFMPTMPYIAKLVVAFTTVPKVTFNVRTLAVLPVTSMPALEPWIQSIIDHITLGMLVLPHRLTINLVPKSEEERLHAERVEALRNLSTRARKHDATRMPVGTLHIDVVAGRHLKSMDSNGLSDPYVKIKFGDLKKRTETIERNLNPKWNAPFEFPVFSNDVREVHFTCMDWDQMSGDDKIGECTFSFDGLPDSEPKDVWLNLGPNNGEIHVRFIFYPSSATAAKK